MADKPQTTTDVARTDAEPVRHRVELFDAMRHDLERVFDRFERGWPFFARNGAGGSSMSGGVMDAALDVRDEGNRIVIEADLPGIDEKDVQVTLNDGVLTIKGERKSEHEEKKDAYHIAERSFGRFERSLRLPQTIDENAIEATFEKGVLHVVAPKRADAVKSQRQIAIKSA